DPAQDLSFGEAHTARRVDDVRVDLPNGDVGVGHDRRDRERNEREDRRPEAEAQTECDRYDESERQERKGWQRPSDVGDVYRDKAATPGVAEVEGDRRGDEERDRDGEPGQLDVLEDADRYAMRSLPVL